MTLTESELFRQFLDVEIIHHTFTGKFDGSTPVRNFIGGNDSQELDDFVVGTVEEASFPDALSLNVLDEGINRLESALRDLNVLRCEFKKACDEQGVPLDDHAPDDAEQLYRPLTQAVAA